MTGVQTCALPISPVEYAAYAPICGLPEFRAAAVKAALKSFSPESSHIRAVATPGGTGALRNVVSNYSCRGDKLITTDWHWAPYNTIADEQARSFVTFKLFDDERKFNATDLERVAKTVQRLEGGAHHTNGDHPGNEQQSIVDIGAGHLLIEHGAENKHHHHRKSHVEQHRLPIPEEGHHFNTYSRQTR